jgi:hypothetical protein
MFQGDIGTIMVTVHGKTKINNTKDKRRKKRNIGGQKGHKKHDACLGLCPVR